MIAMSKYQDKHLKTASLPREKRSGILDFISSQRFFSLVALFILLAVFFPVLKTYNQRRLVEREIAEVQEQISEYEGRNQELQQLINYLQSDQSLEDQARLNLNLKKPGEAVVIIENKKNNTTQQTLDMETKASNLSKWWRYFFGR